MAKSDDEHSLALCVMENLEKQHDWTCLEIHTVDKVTQQPSNGQYCLVRGIPPRRLYVHPDEQIRILKAARNGDPSLQERATIPEAEWVLPAHTAEKWTLADFAAVFDSIEMAPTRGQDTESIPEQHKRLLLAGVDFDSTVVYYFVHDGLVKPRQN
jgi:tRNA-splicing endonuclease subunit Sen15, fungi type